MLGKKSKYMALFPTQVKDTVLECAYWADRIIRSELIAGIITSENDYTSNFTGAFRREINSRDVPGLKATSYVLSPRDERKFGADAAIILANKNQFKIGLFEAKWPRLSTHVNYWDSLQTKSKKSHFDDQLARQHAAPTTYPIWEMFYCEYDFGKQPSYFPSAGSACVWHDNAFRLSQNRKSNNVPWTDSELKQLLSNSCNEITEILSEICDCTKGDPINGQTYQNVFRDNELPKNTLAIHYSGDLDDL